MRRGQESPADKWPKKTSPGGLGTAERMLSLLRVVLQR